MQLTLKQVIDTLRDRPSDLLLSRGWTFAQAARGYADQLAFIPCAQTCTVAELLRTAELALGQDFPGWKGGSRRMTDDTLCNLAAFGEIGEELTEELLGEILASADGNKKPNRESDMPPTAPLPQAELPTVPQYADITEVDPEKDDLFQFLGDLRMFRRNHRELTFFEKAFGIELVAVYVRSTRALPPQVTKTHLTLALDSTYLFFKNGRIVMLTNSEWASINIER